MAPLEAHLVLINLNKASFVFEKPHDFYDFWIVEMVFLLGVVALFISTKVTRPYDISPRPWKEHF